MGKRKRGGKKKVFKPFCYYCDREFDDLKVLLDHQKAKHFKCPHCPRRLTSVSGMVTHVTTVHKMRVTEVPNAKEDRNHLDFDVIGMEGIPYEFLEEKYEDDFPDELEDLLPSVAMHRKRMREQEENGDNGVGGAGVSDGAAAAAAAAAHMAMMQHQHQPIPPHFGGFPPHMHHPPFGGYPGHMPPSPHGHMFPGPPPFHHAPYGMPGMHPPPPGFGAPPHFPPGMMPPFPPGMMPPGMFPPGMMPPPHMMPPPPGMPPFAAPGIEPMASPATPATSAGDSTQPSVVVLSPSRSATASTTSPASNTTPTAATTATATTVAPAKMDGNVVMAYPDQEESIEEKRFRQYKNRYVSSPPPSSPLPSSPQTLESLQQQQQEPLANNASDEKQPQVEDQQNQELTV